MSLYLVDVQSPNRERFEAPERDLRRLPARPGVSQFSLTFKVSALLATAIEDAAREEGFREDAWIGVVVESERAVRLAAQMDGDLEDVRTHLDGVAAKPLSPLPGAPLRSNSFAAAIRALRPRNENDQVVARLRAQNEDEVTIRASVPLHAVSAWRRAAIEAQLPLGAWASDHLEAIPRHRLLWEAAAVEAGETLASWVLAQDARRRSAR
jgi:hypothetical protein